jgi:fructose-1-phosphate kinase PfkB-like protein
MHDAAELEVLVLCASPAIQRTELLDNFGLNTVNRVRYSLRDAGGKGAFVSRVLRQLGIPLRYLCQSGTNHDEYRDLLAIDQIPNVLIPNHEPIRHCVTLIEASGIDEFLLDSSEHHLHVRSISELVEASNPVEKRTAELFLETSIKNLAESSVLVISGSLAPGFDPEIFAQIVFEAHRQEIFTILDIRGQELLHALAHQPGIVKINLDEFVKTFLPDFSAQDIDDDRDYSEQLKKRIVDCMVDITEDSRSTVVISRGSRPVWYARAGVFAEYAIPAIPHGQVKNPIGSGDAFTAGLAAWVHAHLEDSFIHEGVAEDLLLKALDYGVRCAQQNVRLVGPGRIRP